MSGAVIPMKRRNLESQLLSKLQEQRVDAQLMLDTYNISPKLFGYYKVEVECYINYLKKYHETIELTTLMNHVMTDDGDESDFKYSSQANTSIKALVDELREFCKRELLNHILEGYKTFKESKKEKITKPISLIPETNTHYDIELFKNSKLEYKKLI